MLTPRKNSSDSVKPHNLQSSQGNLGRWGTRDKENRCIEHLDDMMQSATPFKIHDENQYSVPQTQGKIKRGLGFGGDTASKGASDVVKPTLTAVKTERKALSILSTNQINNRLNTQSKSVNPSKANDLTAKRLQFHPTPSASTKMEMKVKPMESQKAEDNITWGDVACTRIDENMHLDPIDQARKITAQFVGEDREKFIDDLLNGKHSEFGQSTDSVIDFLLDIPFEQPVEIATSEETMFEFVDTGMV